MSKRLKRFVLLLRLEYLGFTASAVMLGVFSASPGASAIALICALGTLVSCHLFGIWHNNIEDRRVDRTHPGRATGSAAEGVLSLRQMWSLSLSQIPIAFAFGYLAGVPGHAHAVLAAAIVAMLIYNRWGKRCPVPFVTDAVQGAAWALLVVYAAALNGTAPTTATWLIGLYFCVYIMLVNGIHGGLRDLANDRAHGAITSSIYFGAHETPHGIHIPRAEWVFSLSCTLLLAVLSVLIAVDSFANARTTNFVLVAIIVVLSNLACFVAMVNGFKRLEQPGHSARPDDPFSLLRVQAGIQLLPVVTVVAAGLSPAASLLVFLCFALPGLLPAGMKTPIVEVTKPGRSPSRQYGSGS